MRISPNILRGRINLLNATMGRPMKSMSQVDDQKWQSNVGNFYVEKNSAGWSILEIVDDRGACRDYGTGMTARECDLVITAMIRMVDMKDPRRG